jgi:hypothetical protein
MSASHKHAFISAMIQSAEMDETRDFSRGGVCVRTFPTMN